MDLLLSIKRPVIALLVQKINYIAEWEEHWKRRGERNWDRSTKFVETKQRFIIISFSVKVKAGGAWEYLVTCSHHIKLPRASTAMEKGCFNTHPKIHNYRSKIWHSQCPSSLLHPSKQESPASHWDMWHWCQHPMLSGQTMWTVIYAWQFESRMPTL